MVSSTATPLKIAIIGAGFSGTALAATLMREMQQPLEIYLFEKTGQFGAGDAYRTPFAYHLLNARAGDMSALEDEPNHFVQWLQYRAKGKIEQDVPVHRQFVPRVLYHQYLSELLRDNTQTDVLTKVHEEVVDLQPHGKQMKLILKNRETLVADKVILALGNNPPSSLPFHVAADIQCIENPWDYTALNNIPADDPVLIVGTGLSMVDAVLTLHHQQHRGNITAVSRRGLIPLPHTEHCSPVEFDVKELPRDVRSLMKVLRMEAAKITAAGGDWRGMMSALRLQLPEVWQRLDKTCRKRFLRHVLPYWNIHRHRVHVKLHDLLQKMCASGQLEILAARVLSAHDGKVQVRLRQSRGEISLPAKHIINCMGSSFEPSEQPLLQSLLQQEIAHMDALQLGVEVAEDLSLRGKSSANCFVLGPLMRGEVWESIAVPEIRKQCKALVGTLLKK